MVVAFATGKALIFRSGLDAHLFDGVRIQFSDDSSGPNCARLRASTPRAKVVNDAERHEDVMYAQWGSPASEGSESTRRDTTRRLHYRASSITRAKNAVQ